MSNKTKRIMTMILAILLVLAMLAGVVLPALADDSLDDLEWEKDQLEQEAEDAEAIANATEEEIAAAQEKLDKVNGEIETINKNLEEVGARLIELNRQISENEDLLAEKEDELAKAQEDMKIYYQALKGRIQMMYENDRVTYLEILLDAGSLSDFFSRFEYISEMVEYDNQIMMHLNDCKVTIENAKATIEATHAQLEADKAEVVEKQAQLSAFLDQKKEQYASLKDDELALQLLRDQQRAEQEALEARISEIQGQIDSIHYQQAMAAQAAAESARRQQQQQQPPQQEEESSEEVYAPIETGESSEEEPSEEPSETSEDPENTESSDPEDPENTESSDPEDPENTESSDPEDPEGEGGEGGEGGDDEKTQHTDPNENEQYYDDTGRYMPDIECWSTYPGIGSGELYWPVGSYLATDLYGWRIHPIYGDERFHNGLDLGASYGSPIYACDSGTVIICEYYGGYGNLIVIDHGNGMTTWYGHQDSFAVAEGDYVERGQVIGYVGSTGDSTGPHLHLEVHIGGSSVDPEWYL